MPELLNAIPHFQFIILAFIFGALWGSFANVVIVRWPRELSVVRPGSHCFSCQAPIRWYDNIPIVSFIILRGRCRHCGAAFSPRYLLVELAMALLSVAVMHITFLRADVLQPAGLLEYVIWFAFVWSLVTVAMIDLSHYLIPDVIVLPGIVAGCLANAFFLPLGWMEPLLAAAAAYAGIRLLFIDGYRLLRGRQGMGHGDAKLLAMLGAFLGFEGVLFALFAGALQGLVIGLAMVAVRRRNGLANEPVFEEELDGTERPQDAQHVSVTAARVPFGPFLALGAVQYLFIGQWALAAYSIGFSRLLNGAF